MYADGKTLAVAKGRPTNFEQYSHWQEKFHHNTMAGVECTDLSLQHDRAAADARRAFKQLHHQQYTCIVRQLRHILMLIMIKESSCYK